MLVPGVAFTPACERLGYGGGFYDTVMAQTRADTCKVAAAFSLQVLETLPVEAHDRCVDMVITEGDVHVRDARDQK
jgi:5-formyltetrahydrofolate cyclo-ligase